MPFRNYSAMEETLSRTFHLSQSYYCSLYIRYCFISELMANRTLYGYQYTEQYLKLLPTSISTTISYSSLSRSDHVFNINNHMCWSFFIIHSIGLSFEYSSILYDFMHSICTMNLIPIVFCPLFTCYAFKHR